MADLFENLKNQIKGKSIRIVLPEANDLRIIEAASRLSAEELVNVILVGNVEETKNLASENNFDVSDCEILDPSKYDKYDQMVESFVERRKGKATEEEARQLLLNANYFGTMLVYMGLADGLVSGATHSTGDTVRPGLQIIKTKPGVSKVFGYFIMQREDERYIFADCAINPNPSSQDLAEFAIESAKAAEMFGIEPKVSLLSFSTNGSAKTEETDKIIKAVAIAKERAPELEIDGEMQFDAAFVPKVAKKKYPESNVAGQAKVFVFPDLNSGNIGYKIAQRLGNFEAVGPVLAGINAPVNDLSRGCNADDAYKTAILTAAQSLM
ncbi:phosphate acetyltransferase [Haloplasma contractile]|uniref:Phosphate acetyltransferase n=1 Tax=Haloplasma contractile SSD-17B TaxID=1033810 RepID=U2FI41_9MOLU|nr:phosphate acetyltransferase [Haloplasma contractile]ERJ12480.1 phosphate acetyltransferase protein [Haloplasma contractile SSD-17B]